MDTTRTPLIATTGTAIQNNSHNTQNHHPEKHKRRRQHIFKIHKKTQLRKHQVSKHKRHHYVSKTHKLTHLPLTEPVPKKYYTINTDLVDVMKKHNINAELIAGHDMNNIINEAQYKNIDSILIEFKYDNYNDFEKIERISTGLLEYIVKHHYKLVIITMPHYCVKSIDTDPNCDLYVEQFCSHINNYLKKHGLKTEYFGINYNRKHIPRIPRKDADMNRIIGSDQPMRLLLRELLYSTRVKRTKTILLDIHSFPMNSFNELPDTDIVLLQRLKGNKTESSRIS
jgi:hypothetical protein